MQVTREVIVDLLPVYLSGEASPATSALIEEFFRGDPDFAKRVRAQWTEGLQRAAPPAMPPELELRSLKRTRRLLATQKWLFGVAMALTAVAFSLAIEFRGGHLRNIEFLIFRYPEVFGTALAIAAPLWIAYFLVRHRVRSAGF